MGKQELMEQIVEHYQRPCHRHPLPDATSRSRVATPVAVIS